MNQEIDVLRRHLGEVEGMSAFKAKQLCSEINDANDFIGALQILDLNLKKIRDHVDQRLNDENLNDVQKTALDASVSKLIQNCSFAGTTLFDSAFKVRMGQKLFEFEIVSPLLVLEKSSYEGVLAYVEDKREEIAALLIDLATAITLDMDFGGALTQNTQRDFKNLFR